MTSNLSPSDTGDIKRVTVKGCAVYFKFNTTFGLVDSVGGIGFKGFSGMEHLLEKNHALLGDVSPKITGLLMLASLSLSI